MYSEERGFYSEERRQELLEEDELNAEEEAFMRGWDDAYEYRETRKHSV